MSQQPPPKLKLWTTNYMLLNWTHSFSLILTHTNMHEDMHTRMQACTHARTHLPTFIWLKQSLLHIQMSPPSFKVWVLNELYSRRLLCFALATSSELRRLQHQQQQHQQQNQQQQQLEQWERISCLESENRNLSFVLQPLFFQKHPFVFLWFVGLVD